MDQQEEFDRHEHIGDFPPKEPREPFLPEENPAPIEGGELRGLHAVEPPVTRKKLAAFLIELRPIVEGIQKLPRKDQHLVAQRILEVKNALHAEGEEEKVLRFVDKIAEGFNNLLVHSAPLDQVGVIGAMNELEKLL